MVFFIRRMQKVGQKHRRTKICGGTPCGALKKEILIVGPGRREEGGGEGEGEGEGEGGGAERKAEPSPRGEEKSKKNGLFFGIPSERPRCICAYYSSV